jgi:hypothetical protein
MIANLKSNNFVRVVCQVGNKETGGYGNVMGNLNAFDTLKFFIIIYTQLKQCIYLIVLK